MRVKIDMEAILEKLDILSREMNEKFEITNNKIDEKFKILETDLNKRVEVIERKVKSYEFETKKRNIIIHNFPEEEINKGELEAAIVELIDKHLDVEFSVREIDFL